jgi:hypothetical protein
VRSKFKIILFLIIAVSLLAAGCTGKGQPDPSTTTAINTSSSGSESSYLQEFSQGYQHHMEARDAFENATSLWNTDNFTDAIDLYRTAGVEFSLAADHYHNMVDHAGNDTERTFADNMEGAAIDLDMASDRFIMSINESVAGNETGALTYFNEGRALVDDSTNKTDSSFRSMPSMFQ